MTEFYYARDHDRGAGAWCVRSSDGFYMAVPEKNLALAIADLLNGKYEEAANLAGDFALAWAEGWRPVA